VPDNVRDAGFKPGGRKVPQKIYRRGVVVRAFAGMRAKRAIDSSARNADDSRSTPRSFALLRMTSPYNDAGVRVKRCGKSAPPRQ
jgi:hypothetical protein